MKKSSFLPFFLALTVFLMWGTTSSKADDVPLQIYINNTSDPVRVERGEPVEIPLFFVGGSLTDTPVEMFVWCEDAQKKVQCFESGGWVPASTDSECAPLGTVTSMPPYLYLNWEAFNHSNDLTPFTLNVCLDPENAGALTAKAVCSQHQVQIYDPDQQPACETPTISPSSVDRGPVAQNSSQTQWITITDSDGKPVPFKVPPGGYPGWVTPKVIGAGQLKLTFDTAVPMAKEQRTVTIVTTDACAITLSIPVSLEVTGESSKGDGWSFSVEPGWDFYSGTTGAPAGGASGSSGGDTGGTTSGTTGGSSTATNPTCNHPLGICPDFSLSGGTSTTSSTCSRLEFTPQGSTYSLTWIKEVLALGETRTVTLLASKCGKATSVSSVSKTSGGSWLSASVSGGNVKVTLNSNAAGIAPGTSYNGRIRVTAGGLVKDLDVVMSVEGKCEASQATLSADKFTFQVVAGAASDAQILRVKDNCGTPLSAKATTTADWLTITPSGTGTFSLTASAASATAAGGLAVGTYTGSITVTTTAYAGALTAAVTMEVVDKAVAPSPSYDNVTPLKLGHIGYYDLRPGEIRLFSVTKTTSYDDPLQIGSTPQPREAPSVDMLVKKGSPPTMTDYEKALSAGGCELWDKTGRWVPGKKYPDLYYCFTDAGGTAEFIEIGEPAEADTYYIMLYNTGKYTVRKQRLTIGY